MSKPSDRKPDEQRFWRAMQNDNPGTHAAGPVNVIDLTSDLSELNADEQEQRRKALRQMLAVTEARQQQLLRSRLPALTPGLLVSVNGGTFRHCQGRVVDADYIHGRALLSIEDEADAQWIDFTLLSPAIDPGPDSVADPVADSVVDPVADRDPAVPDSDLT